MAKAPKDLLVFFGFPLKGWDTGWARAAQKPLTTPDCQNVMPFDLDRRARGAKRPGFSILTGGSIGSVDLTYREAHRCEDDVFAGFFVPTTEISAYPYTFSYSGACYYIIEADAAVTSPTGTILSAGLRTSYDDCAACDDAVNPSPPPATYRRLRRCSDDSLSSLWVAMADVPDTTKRLLNADDNNCYYVNVADATAITHGTLVGTTTEYTNCTLCQTAADDNMGGDGCFWQAKRCSDDVLVDCWISQDDATANPDFTGYFFRTDFLDEPVYFDLDSECVSITPGRVYDIATETLPASSCTKSGGCYEDSLPGTANLTFTGLTLQPSCRTCDSSPNESWKTTGTINHTYVINKVSENADRAVYEGALGGTADLRLFGYGSVDNCRANTTCSSATIDGCAAVVTERTGWVARLEVDKDLGTVTGWRVTIDEGNPAQGPRAFRGTKDTISSCRGSKTISNDLSARVFGNPTSTSADDAIASGGSVVVTLGF